MSRKPTLSPSKITTYLACPVKYGWTYLDSRGKWYLKSKSYYSFGSTLHKVLERFHDSNDTGVTTLGDALQVYEDSWIDAGYTSAEEMAEAFGEGREIISRHVAEQLSREVDSITLFVERTIRADLGDFVLLGRVDRVDEHADGTLEVIDYKSGRASVSDEDVASDLAMSIYQLIMSKNYPGKPVMASILALKSQSKASASLDEKELESLEKDLRFIGQEILSMSMEDRVPVRKPLCNHCDFLTLCSKHPDFD